jgi:hypothetical protein
MNDRKESIIEKTLPPILIPQEENSKDSTVPVGGMQSGFAGQMLALLEKANRKDIELRTILEAVSGHSHAALIVFLSFPLCISLGIPVLSTTLGLALGLAGFLLATGRNLWIPKSIGTKQLPYGKLAYIIERLLRISVRIERWFHPRLLFFATDTRMIRVHGAFIMVLGIVAAFPLPLPFNNFVAAFPILLLGLSLLERDGILVIVSYLSAIPFFIYYGALLYLSHAGFARLIEFLKI